MAVTTHLYMSRSVLNANVSALNSYIGSLTLHNLYFIAYIFLP